MPKYKVILVGPPPIDETEHNQRIKSLGDKLKFHAGLLGISYIDIFSVLIDDIEYQQEIINNDGAHPPKAQWHSFKECRHSVKDLVFSA